MDFNLYITLTPSRYTYRLPKAVIYLKKLKRISTTKELTPPADIPTMTSKTQNKKELIHGLKTNCKKGYNLLAETQAELTATQKWIIDKLTQDACLGDYGELTRFLTDLNISIKVPQYTWIKPYTNKKGKTTMKHYTVNGFMVNDLKGDEPVLYPTWIKFNDTTLHTNEGGHFTSFADQTVYTIIPPPVKVEDPTPEEVLEIVTAKAIQDLIKGKITVAVLTNYCRENKFKGHTKMKTKEALIAFILKQ